ncbi:DUF2834 domain-containing protein [Leptolyngbya sp. FACHB-321]|uniref:DUF2834 domain-containing protein n=1 Tax=Leptolyngbya sp. FACHB-321 TaxID=2692807 RepID=UPI001688DD3C|nr:DUF2834 domain-containing protein [Leptolyngbya sp. FACHB-321]MBD2035053.1 DUF2834 domain-containing protein [Leptolyngbya sp. FACHB-321]
MSRIGFWLVWIGFVTYAFFLAPPDRPDTFDLIKHLVTGQIAGINPLIVALFNLMGVLPMLYSCLLLIDGRMQKIPAWLFATASFAVGAFAIVPYLALREPNGTFSGKKTWWLKVLDSRWLGLALAITTLGLLFYGISQGDWTDFGEQWRSSRFIHVMSLDFCLLSVLFPALLRDDMTRRGLTDDRLFWAVALLPLLGAIVYLVLRPPLQEQPENAVLPQPNYRTLP